MCVYISKTRVSVAYYVCIILILTKPGNTLTIRVKPMDDIEVKRASDERNAKTCLEIPSYDVAPNL